MVISLKKQTKNNQLSLLGFNKMANFLCRDLTDDDGAAGLHFNGVLPMLRIMGRVYSVNRRRLTQSSRLFWIKADLRTRVKVGFIS